MTTGDYSKAIHYNFVDFIRIFGIAGIIWAHVPIFPPKNFNPLLFDLQYLYFPFMQFWKFGVINFFMISGFLLRGKLEYNHFSYLKKRFLAVTKPYIFALTIFALLYGYHVYRQVSPNSTIVNTVYYMFSKIVLNTSFWFIPSYFLSLTILMLSKKYINSIFYGLLLFSITLALAIVSTYFHNMAVPYLDMALGFPFFLWLGYTINDKILIAKILRRSNFLPLAILTIVGLGLSSFESYHLYTNQLPTYFNTLRLSNIIYSISIFFFMMHFFNKTSTRNVLNKIKSNSYSMYLYHPIFAWVVVPKIGVSIERVFGVSIFEYSFIYFSIIFIFTYLFIFLSTYLLVRILQRIKPLSWLIINGN
jgi:fucose 4-O-acetylase-like acetyltransferase